jgi:peptide chain release factor subunit 1
LNQAIELSQECLLNVKFVREKNLISQFFEEISKDSGMVVYGIEESMKTLESGAVENLICWEGLEHFRVQLKNKDTGTISYVHIHPNDINNPKYYKDPDTGAELETVDSVALTEWLAENYDSFGADLQIITNKSPEGFQFVKGFSGLGGFLRYKLDLEHLINNNDKWEEEDEDFI